MCPGDPFSRQGEDDLVVLSSGRHWYSLRLNDVHETWPFKNDKLFNRDMKVDERPTRILVAVFTRESLQVVRSLVRLTGPKGAQGARLS